MTDDLEGMLGPEPTTLPTMRNSAHEPRPPAPAPVWPPPDALPHPPASYPGQPLSPQPFYAQYPQQPAVQAYPPPQGAPQAWQRPAAEPLAATGESMLLRPVAAAPEGAVRKIVYWSTGGRVNRASRKQLARMELEGRIRVDLTTDHRIAVVAGKGGSGKTTTTTSLGSTIARVRGDRVLGLDMDPDMAVLSRRFPGEGQADLFGLLESGDIEKYSQIRKFTTRNTAGLEALGPRFVPGGARPPGPGDYLRAVAQIERFYNVVLTDCGNGLTTELFETIINDIGSLVVVAAQTVASVRGAIDLLERLSRTGHVALASRSVTVLNAIRPGVSNINLNEARAALSRYSRAVQVVPFDDHLAEDGLVDHDALAPVTQQALLELAALVADDFPAHRRPVVMRR